MTVSVILTRGEYKVEVMADSWVTIPIYLYAKGGHRLITLRIKVPRIVLAEINTHRLFSRNSASSRAIPISKMIQWVLEHPFIPDRFPKTHTGMQASEWIEKGTDIYDECVAAWLGARDLAVETVRQLDVLQISKQLANRILEPFLMHEIVLTATEWENFIALRAHSDAQNEIRIIAEMILQALSESKPTVLEPGQWHLPFGDTLDYKRLGALAQDMKDVGSPDELARMVTVARCARTSYMNFEGKDDYSADITMYRRLKDQGHWSPFEHVARAMTPAEYMAYSHTYPTHTEYGWCGNFRGFIQQRKLFAREVENRLEPRLEQFDL
jgi:thymidylate synthase ThyX